MSVATKRKELAVTEVDGRAEACRALTKKPGLSEEREGSMGLLFFWLLPAGTELHLCCICSRGRTMKSSANQVLSALHLNLTWKTPVEKLLV